MTQIKRGRDENANENSDRSECISNDGGEEIDIGRRDENANRKRGTITQNKRGRDEKANENSDR